MATAAVSAGASILGAVLGGKGAKAAARQQAAALDKALAEQRAAREQNQANFQPYLNAGTSALGGDNGLLTLLGLNGGDLQNNAIQALKLSPAYTSQFDSGLDAINQSAAATGGLRGGNAALAQSNFGANLLNTVLGQQIGNLGSLVQTGTGAANSIGGFNQNSVNSISSLLGQQGSAQAAGTLGATNAYVNGINDIGKLFGSGGAGSSIFGGGASNNAGLAALLNQRANRF